MAAAYRIQWIVASVGAVCLAVGVSQVVAHYVVLRGTYMCNTGIAMGIAIPSAVFTVLWVGVVVALGWMWWRSAHKTAVDHVSFLLIFAGACSNMVDRIFYGCVIDYIPFLTVSSFNLADVWITCGALVVAWRMFRNTRH